jgi:hypothetical protein
MRKHGVPKTMIRATRYGSGSTRLKPSSCASTAGSPSMTANPWFECVQKLTFKESRALSQTATSQNTFNGAFVVNTPVDVGNLTKRLHKRSCKQDIKLTLASSTPRSRIYHRRFGTKSIRHEQQVSRASRLVMLRLRLDLEYLMKNCLCSSVLPSINSPPRLYFINLTL